MVDEIAAAAAAVDMSTLKKRRGRPRKTDETNETADLRAQLRALSAQVALMTTQQTQSGGISADQLKEVMSGLIAMQTEANLAAQREIAEREQREDINYPRISAFSHPEGDKKRPRDPFKCKMFQNGYDCDWDTTPVRELDLMNQLEPGEYTFFRIDGQTKEILTVTGERNATGKLTKLEMTFPTKENRETLPSMATILRQALGIQTPEQAEIARLKAQLAQMTPKVSA